MEWAKIPRLVLGSVMQDRRIVAHLSELRRLDWCLVFVGVLVDVRSLIPPCWQFSPLAREDNIERVLIPAPDMFAIST